MKGIVKCILAAMIMFGTACGIETTRRWADDEDSAGASESKLEEGDDVATAEFTPEPGQYIPHESGSGSGASNELDAGATDDSTASADVSKQADAAEQGTDADVSDSSATEDDDSDGDIEFSTGTSTSGGNDAGSTDTGTEDDIFVTNAKE